MSKVINVLKNMGKFKKVKLLQMVSLLSDT